MLCPEGRREVSVDTIFLHIPRKEDKKRNTTPFKPLQAQMARKIKYDMFSGGWWGLGNRSVPVSTRPILPRSSASIFTSFLTTNIHFVLDSYLVIAS